MSQLTINDCLSVLLGNCRVLLLPIITEVMCGVLNVIYTSVSLVLFLENSRVKLEFHRIKRQIFNLYCPRRVPVLIFIRYAHSQNIGKPNNLSIFRQSKAKGLNRIAMSLPTTLDLSTNNSSTYNIIFLKSGIKYLYKCNPTPDKNNLGGIIDLNLLYQ